MGLGVWKLMSTHVFISLSYLQYCIYVYSISMPMWWHRIFFSSGLSQCIHVIFVSTQCLISWLKVGAIVWKMVPSQSPAMSKLRWHVDSPVLWMQIKKGDQKSYQNTTDIWQLLVSGSLFISAPGILKINGFCTDAICCQDWCFSPWNKVLLVLYAAVYAYRLCFSSPFFSFCVSIALSYIFLFTLYFHPSP